MNLELHRHHGPKRYHRAFALGVLLNSAYALGEFIAGLWLHSVALMADAGHNLSDVAALLLSWGAFRLAERAPSRRHTYGYQRLTIIAVLVSGVLLLGTVAVIAVEAIDRLSHPEPPPALHIVWIALTGVAVNIGSAWLFHAGSRQDLNLRGAWLHLLADAAVSAGVVAGALLLYATGWALIDPLLGLLIGGNILAATWGLLGEGASLAADAVPRHIDPNAVREYLNALPGVTAVHDLHIWPLSTTETALTAHLVMPEAPASDRFFYDLAGELKSRFTIDHPTLQIERGDLGGPQAGCAGACEVPAAGR